MPVRLWMKMRDLQEEQTFSFRLKALQPVLTCEHLSIAAVPFPAVVDGDMKLSLLRSSLSLPFPRLPLHFCRLRDSCPKTAEEWMRGGKCNHISIELCGNLLLAGSKIITQNISRLTRDSVTCCKRREREGFPSIRNRQSCK